MCALSGYREQALTKWLKWFDHAAAPRRLTAVGELVKSLPGKPLLAAA